jgi:hypothetical protein
MLQHSTYLVGASDGGYHLWVRGTEYLNSVPPLSLGLIHRIYLMSQLYDCMSAFSYGLPQFIVLPELLHESLPLHRTILSRIQAILLTGLITLLLSHSLRKHIEW